jgi:hypothetical protein
MDHSYETNILSQPTSWEILPIYLYLVRRSTWKTKLTSSNNTHRPPSSPPTTPFKPSSPLSKNAPSSPATHPARGKNAPLWQHVNSALSTSS